jgi:2-dehydropantoate 2-reductase
MRIAVYGAGSIGGYLAVHLARAGAEVAVVARGATLAAIREQGLRLVTAKGTLEARPRCAEDPSQLGRQDYVILAVKAHSIPAIVDRVQPLLGLETAVVTAANGIPWWYFYKHPAPWENLRLESVDPGGRIWSGIGAERAIGCVVYPACQIESPGVIVHESGDRFTLGEPDGTTSERSRNLAAVLIQAGIKAPVRSRIRNEIWVKLWGNVSFNPISALTGATLDVITGDPATRALARSMMIEAREIGERLGVDFGIDVDKRIAGAAAVGEHKTSMLQDLERGREMEIDAIVAAVQELGSKVGVPTPHIDTVLALVRQRARVSGLYI